MFNFHPPPPPPPPPSLALKPFSTNWTHCTSYILFKPLGVVHVPVPQKPSDEITSRTRLNRTKALETVGNKISSHRFDVHVIHTLKRKSQEERRQILHEALGKGTCPQHPRGSSKCYESRPGDNMVSSK